MKEQNPWKTLKSERPYENNWIAIDHNEVLNPAGNPGIYGVVHFKNLAIGIVTLDEDGNTHLVGQWRYPLKAYSWEIPEGGGPLKEDPLAAAKRELQEETGLIAKRWTRLVELDLSNSVSDERGIVYLAQELEQGSASPEETEVFQHRKLPLSEALSWIEQGKIRDALSIIGLYAADRFLSKKQ